MSTTTDAPVAHSPAASSPRAYARWRDIPAGFRCTDAVADRARRPLDHAAGLTEVLRIARAERARLADAQEALAVQRPRLIQTRRALGAVHAWVVALRRDLIERHAGLKAELVRLTNALDRISSEDARVAAACQMLNAHLAAADRMLRTERVWPVDAAGAARDSSRTFAPPELSRDRTSASEVKRALEARRAGLTELLERERARWAETLTALQETVRSLGQ